MLWYLPTGESRITEYSGTLTLSLYFCSHRGDLQNIPSQSIMVEWRVPRRSSGPLSGLSDKYLNLTNLHVSMFHEHNEEERKLHKGKKDGGGAWEIERETISADGSFLSSFEACGVKVPFDQKVGKKSSLSRESAASDAGFCDESVLNLPFFVCLLACPLLGRAARTTRLGQGRARVAIASPLPSIIHNPPLLPQTEKSPAHIYFVLLLQAGFIGTLFKVELSLSIKLSDKPHE